MLKRHPLGCSKITEYFYRPEWFLFSSWLFMLVHIIKNYILLFLYYTSGNMIAHLTFKNMMVKGSNCTAITLYNNIKEHLCISLALLRM